MKQLITEKVQYNIRFCKTQNHKRWKYVPNESRETKQSIQEAKHEYLEKGCDRLEQYIEGTKTKEAWGCVKSVKKTWLTNKNQVADINKLRERLRHSAKRRIR